MSLSRNGFFYPKVTIWMGKMMINHQILGNTLFSDKPNSDVKTFPQQKMDKQKRMKRKEYYVAPSTVGAAGCLSYIPQIEFDLPCKSSPLCAPFASHCCTSCRMKPNHWSLPTSSISPCDWSEGSEISREPPKKKWCSTSFPIRSLKNCHDLWVNPPFLANKSVCFASSSCCTSVWEPQIAEVAFS